MEQKAETIFMLDEATATAIRVAEETSGTSFNGYLDSFLSREVATHPAPINNEPGE